MNFLRLLPVILSFLLLGAHFYRAGLLPLTLLCVAVLFLLFSAVHGAITLLEEKDSGILDRILAGPERIESGWWDGRDCRRDYFIVRDAHGSTLWAYHEYKPCRGWYLHGIFA